MDLKLLKTEDRRRALEEIAGLPGDYIAASDRGLFCSFMKLKEYSSARKIMLYYSINKEPDTLEIAKAALLAGKAVAFPLCLGRGVMQARVVSSLSQLEPAVLGIPAPTASAPLIEPEELELIIVPALVYDKLGYRLGYGGGYYDRFLSGIRAFTVGLTRERLIKEKLPVEPHDIKVSCVITEEKNY